MEVFESKSQSQGQYSHIISENVEGFQQRINEIHNLFGQDEDFSKLTAEIYKSKKSELRKLVTELSGLHMALADQNVHLVEETQHVDSSTSTSTQVSPTDKTDKIGYEGSESSLTISSSSELLNSPVKNDASKVKEVDVHDPDALLKKISDLEKEAVNLWEQILNLTDKNEILEAEKAKVADLKPTISESDRKIETMGKEIEGSRKQVLTAEDENSKLKEEQTELLRTIESIEKNSALLNEQLGLQQHRESELEEKVMLGLAEIANRDEQITELNTQIDELKNSHAAEENRWNTDMKRLKTDLRRNYDREVSALKKENKNLTNENAMLEAEKTNVADLKRMISESNRKIETMGKVIETSRKQVKTADEENLKLKEKLSTKALDLTRKIDSIENRYHEKVKLGLAEIAKRDEQIAELKTQIDLLKNSLEAEEDVEKLKKKLEQFYEIEEVD